MAGLRVRRTRSLGGGLRMTATNRGVRLGYSSKGRPGVTGSIGTNGRPYASARIARGVWYVLTGGGR